MAAQTVFYTGPGVLPFNGKDYRFGDLLPIDFPAESIKSMLKKKKASTTKPAGSAPAGDANDNALLVRRVQELTADVERLTGAAADAESKVQDLSGQLADAQKTIEQLTDQLTKAPAAPTGAGPKK